MTDPTTTTPSIEEVWRRISAHTGEVFTTISGLPFTYTVAGNVLRTDVTDYNLTASEFQKAVCLLPLSGPGKISQIVRGPTYVWAILHDHRVLSPQEHQMIEQVNARQHRA